MNRRGVASTVKILYLAQPLLLFIVSRVSPWLKDYVRVTPKQDPLRNYSLGFSCNENKKSHSLAWKTP